MKAVTVKELQKLLHSNHDLQLVDVREPEEHQEFNIGGALFPLNEITRHIDGIEKNKPVIIYCRKGIRSQIAIQRLEEKFPFNNLFNLIGGTDAWRKMLDESGLN